MVETDILEGLLKACIIVSFEARTSAYNEEVPLPPFSYISTYSFFNGLTSDT